MLYKLSTLVLFLMLATPGVALAQGTGTLAGTVIDDFDQPLPGANVLIEGTQLGAATDINGNYRVIGIPVGQYDITISFVGYGSVTTENVTISSGSTRELNIQLAEGELLEGLIVEYTRPLIETGAIGVPKVVSGEDIENLPVRGVTNVAALQGSVVGESGGDDLFIRGGRDEEVAYYVDGVKVSSLAQVAVNEQSIQEQEMLIGTIPPQYGDVQSGVISITTKSGSDKFFGSAELITSEVLDDYGYNLGSLSIGGPLYPGVASFFLSAQGELVADDSPWGTETFELSDERYNALQQNPQVLRVRDRTTGEETFVNFPVQQIQEAAAADPNFVPSQSDVRGFVEAAAPGQYEILEFNPVDAPSTFTASDFTTRRGKDDPRDEFTLNGNVTLNLPANFNLRMGGAYNTSDRQTDFFTGDFFDNSLYNRGRGYNDARDSFRGYVRLNQRFGTNTFYQIQGEYQNYKRVLSPEGFSSDIGNEFLRYGDIENDPYYEVARRYYTADGSSYEQSFGRPADPSVADPGSGNATPNQAAIYTFNLPGAPASGNTLRFQQNQNEQIRFSANLNTQIGVNQLQIGGEFEKETRRLYSASPVGYAQVSTGAVDDPDTPQDESRYGSYDQIPYTIVAPRATYYGYNYLGTEEVDSENLQEFFTFDEFISPFTGDTSEVRRNTNIAPYEPLYFAGFASDKIEFGDLVIQLGARLDVFDNNSSVLRDLYAPRPIVRAEDLGSCRGVDPAGNGVNFACGLIAGETVDLDAYSRPGGIGDDYAVYFGGSSDNQGQVVGYRDLEGRFYNVDGTPAMEEDITVDAVGQVSVGTLDDTTFNEVFTDYEPQVTFMPRVGVSFPVTDRALFFASYNVTSQRPTERAFTPFDSFVGLTAQNSRTSNPALLPEKTTQYELGFRQRVGERAAVTVSGFYRTQDNKISNRPLFGGFPAYGTYLNEDFTTTKGVELGFDLRRTQNLAINANYTLSFAEGTGSDAAATATIVWRGTQFPNSLSPADFDQRHTINASADYRLGADEGPELFGARVLENFGMNVLLQYGSGQRFTRLLSPNPNSIGDDFTSDAIGGINGSVLPATTRIDLRVDRSFDLGFAGSRLKAYLWVQNVLDTKNDIAVYRATQLPDQDGFLQTTAGNGYLNTEAGLADGYAFNYGAFAGGPVNVGGSQSSNGGFFYGLPRRVRLGFLFNF